MLFARTATRRAILAASLALVAVAGTSLVRTRALDAAPVVDSTSKEPSDKWLDGIKAPHRQFFDAPTENGGIALVHVMNYMDTYNKHYKVKDADIDAVLNFYGATTFFGLNDAVWAKYQLGEFMNTIDAATGKPAVVNPWRKAPIVLGMTIPGASLESLHARGATLILCNNALQIFSGLLASKRGLDPKVVYEDLKANILPQVELVPAMVIAIEQAQRAGMSYHRQ